MWCIFYMNTWDVPTNDRAEKVYKYLSCVNYFARNFFLPRINVHVVISPFEMKSKYFFATNILRVESSSVYYFVETATWSGYLKARVIIGLIPRVGRKANAKRIRDIMRLLIWKIKPQGRQYNEEISQKRAAFSRRLDYNKRVLASENISLWV